jgi:hypothetical protein
MQDQMGRAEGYGIVHADEQYIVPTDGKPIRGLIQVPAAAQQQSSKGRSLVALAQKLCTFLLTSTCAFTEFFAVILGCFTRLYASHILALQRPQPF